MIKNIKTRNSKTGETKLFNSLDDFKEFFTDYFTILALYNEFTNKTGDKSFLNAFDFNWNCFRTNNWAILSYSNVGAKNKKSKERGNGEGSIYWSDTLQCYVAQYTDPSTNKRQTIKQRKNEKPSDFKKRFNDVINKINKGIYISNSDETFISILEKHVDQKSKDNLLGSSSHDRDLQTVVSIKKTCSNFIYKPIQKISVEDIQVAKEEIKKYADNTITKIWRLLNKTFSLAISRRLIIFNPMEDEDLVKPISIQDYSPVEALTISEQNSLVDILNKRKDIFATILLLQLNTGMRIGEILALSTDCIDFKENTITVYRTLTREHGTYVLGKHTKTYDRKKGIDKGKRTFPMTPFVKNLLKNYMHKQKITNINQLIFWDYDKNTLIQPRRLNNYLSSINKAENIATKDFTTHVLRHTFITRCQEKGIPLVVIQAMVGHVEGSDITNNTYTSVSLEFIKEELKKII